MKASKKNTATGAFFWMISAVLLTAFSCVTAFSQSTDQSFPTAVTGNELSGRIRARDIGDSRLTAYYYTFNARQGDLFVNLVTKNLNGTVEIFAADGLRPLGQIIVYSDLASSETGRVIYLRKAEKILLRVEGRTPNDDPAEFQLKFAGSFEAAAPTEETPPPKVSDSALANDSGVKVNSVGTIIAVAPKPTPRPVAKTVDSESVLKAEAKPESQPETTPAEAKPTTNAETTPADTEAKNATETKPTEQPASTETKPDEKPKTDSAMARKAPLKRPVRGTKTAAKPKNETSQPSNTEIKPEASSPTATETKSEAANSAKTPTKTATARRNPRVVVTDTTQPKPDPLASINLVILFKDGTRIDRPMNEVLRFSVDRGILTVVSKDGTAAKYSILDVASVTIQ